jgi:hypothetical protein
MTRTCGPILTHYILILSQLVFILSALFCVINGEAANTNCTIFGLIRQGLTSRYTTLEEN